MNRAIMLTLLAGCGRVAFDGQPDAARGDSRDDALGVASCPGMASVFDEDSDLAGDPCDVCPHLVDDQADGDNDGVGDACDPEPLVGRQRIAFFDGFNVERPEWAFNAPVTGGQLVIDLDGSGEQTIEVLNLPMSSSLVQMGGTILRVGPMPHLFVMAELSANESYYVEMVDKLGTGRRRSLMHEVSMTFDELDGITEAGVAIQAGSVTMMLSLGADRLDARVATGGAADANLTRIGTGAIAGTRVLVFVDEVSLVYDYAVMIETL